MGKFSQLLVLFLIPTAAYAVGPQSPCPALSSSKDKAKWVWMDRNCHLRDRGELDRMLTDHKRWLKKYAAYLGDEEALKTHRALGDPLRADLAGAQLPQANLSGVLLIYADLSGADLTSASLSGVDFTHAVMGHADLTNADLRGADFTGAYLDWAHLTGAHLTCADPDAADPKCVFLGGVHLNFADLTGVELSGADLTNASLGGADLTCSGRVSEIQVCADLENADFSSADLEEAKLVGANLGNAKLDGANLNRADMTGANLIYADLSKASLVQTDLSSAMLQQADFSDADLTLAKLWYADFEPKAPPLRGTIPAGEGLETVRWFEPLHFTNELDYRRSVEQARLSHGSIPMPPVPPMQDRWLVWLSCRRERVENEARERVANKNDGWVHRQHGWGKDALFLVTDVLFGSRPRAPECASLANTEIGQRYQQPGPTTVSQEDPGASPVSTLAGYQLVDIRTAAQGAGHPEVALDVNLAIQRHTQTQLKMIAFDWTCAYGSAPVRPIILAVLLAVAALPLYWFGFRRPRLGVRLLRVEEDGKKEEEVPIGGWCNRPPWRRPLGVKRIPQSAWRLRLLTRLHLKRPTHGLRLCLASRWPRIRWEACFLKAVVLFSLISVIDLGFDGFDFGRWVRMLFFTEYDLKARGWLRFVSGLQSLLGLGLLTLSLLSFFGHPFN